MTTLVRVKRKRTADPVEALVLSCKRAKTGSTSGGSGGAKSSASSNSAVKNVFRFAGTVAQKDHALPKTIEDAIHKGQSLYKSKGGVNATVKAKQQQKLSSLNNRYRMVAKHRGITLDLPTETAAVANAETDSGKPKKKSSSLRKKLVRRLSLKTSTKESTNSGSSSIPKEVDTEIQRLFNIYEVVQENLDDVLSNKPAKLASLDDDDDAEAVMCNNVKMLREKLTIDESNTHHQGEMDEYVYDLYYAEPTDFDFNTEHIVLALDPYDMELTHDMEERQEVDDQDEDDDSNDENNWRNDYPDEDPDYFNQRHTDMFDEYVDDYRYGDMSSDDDAFNEYSDKRYSSKVMNCSDKNGVDSDLEMYS